MAMHAFERRGVSADPAPKSGSAGPILFVGLIVAVLAFFAVGRAPVRTSEPMAQTPLAWDSALPASAQEQPILLYFTASWCPPCKVMKSDVLPTERVVDAARGYLPVMIDVDQDPVTAGRYQVASIPTTLILAPDGSIRAREVGLLSPRQLAEMLDGHRGE